MGLVVTDPPYNIGKAEWDKISDYIDWCGKWLTECQRVLKPNGVLYFFHSDIPQIAQLMDWIQENTGFIYRSFLVWDKGNWRAQSWKNRVPGGKSAPRSWFNICEYCLHYVLKDGRKTTSDSESFKSLKEWYHRECERLSITKKEIAQRYTEVTGRQPHMLKHYFQDYQFELPTKEVWEKVYIPLGFDKSYAELRQEYVELLPQEYRERRYVHTVDPEHCNVIRINTLNNSNRGQQRIHPTQKPEEIVRRLIRVSSRPGEVVLDPFMGSGTTAVSAIKEGRQYIGFELDADYFVKASERVTHALEGV